MATSAYHRTFKNELGNSITVSSERVDGGKVKLKIVGPRSEAENIVTKREARAMQSALGAALRGN